MAQDGWRDGDVDFVVGEPDDGDDEELPGAGADPRRTRRLRFATAVAVLAVIVALIGVRFAGGSDDKTPQADPSSSPTHSSTPSSGAVLPTGFPAGGASVRLTPVVVIPAHVPARHGDDPRACPAGCTSSDSVPSAVTAAIQNAFPESLVDSSITLRLRGSGQALWYREVIIRAGETRVTLRVQAPSAHDRTGTGSTTAHGVPTAFVRGTLGPWHVDVEASDLSGGAVDLAALGTLADDPRITVVPSTSTKPRRSTATAHCTAATSCETSTTTTAALARAIHTAVPRATRLRTTTTFQHSDAPGSNLVTRRITARSGPAGLTITVRAAGGHDDIGWNASETAAHTLVTVSDHVRGRLVSLRFSAPPGNDPDIPALRRLAADPILVR